MRLKTAAVIAFAELIVLSIAVSAQARIGWTLRVHSALRSRYSGRRC